MPTAAEKKAAATAAKAAAGEPEYTAAKPFSYRAKHYKAGDPVTAEVALHVSNLQPDRITPNPESN